MKKLLWLFIPMMAMLFACQKEIQPGDDAALGNGNNVFGNVPGGVKKPMKVTFYSSPRRDLPPVLCSPTPMPNFYLAGGFHVGGSGTHIGEVQMMHSPFTITSCGFNLEGKLMMTGNGVITADNGDKFYYTATTFSNMADFTFTGPVVMTGGTGRFEGSTSEVTMTGQQFPDGTAMWTAEGWIIMAK